MTKGNGNVGIKMVDLEMAGSQEVERIFHNYTLSTEMINMEKLMQPVLPPIKKRQAGAAGLDRSVLQEIDSMMRYRY